MLNVEVKNLSPDRWKDYRDLRLEALKSDPTAFGTSYEEEVTLTEDTWQRRAENVLFAMFNDKPIGMVVYIFNDRLKTKHIANIFGMYVAKEYRNRGLANKLITSVISLIEENKDIRKIKLSVNPEQVYAFRLYIKYGFQCVGTARKEYYIDSRYYDEVLMEKHI